MWTVFLIFFAIGYCIGFYQGENSKSENIN